MTRKAILGAAALCLATSVWATPELHFTGTGLGGNVLTSRDGGASFNAYFCGELNVQRCDIASDPFYGFCTSTNVLMNQSSCWAVDILDTNSIPTEGVRVGNLVKTYATGVHAASDGLSAQMLQAVIWELTTETSGTFDLTSGSFIVENSDGSALNAGQMAQAQVYFNDLSGGVSTWYRSGSDDTGNKLSQDIVTPVPEPGTIAAIATGLIPLALRRRKR